MSSQNELLGKIRGYRSEKKADLVDPEIGCIILVQPFFLLFDSGLITVTPDNHIEVSSRIREG